MNIKELITHETGNAEAWICICGNRPNYDGFFPCNQNGDEMNPGKGWEDLYVCGRCGRIINQHSLEVVGRNPHFKRLD
jgi:hypothetical protein